MLVSIDGIEGSGKSTLAVGLGSCIPGCLISPEFSDSEMGIFLKNQVLAAPHFISKSEMAQSLLFLSEYAERIEAISQESASAHKPLRIIERGHLSKYSYQTCVLERRFSPQQAHDLVTAILDMIPRPDATILLRVSQDTLVRRLSNRTVPVDPKFLSFLARADNLMFDAIPKYHPTLVIDTSALTPKDVVELAVPFIKSAS